ncbi:MAG TPA: cytochrome c biogenesis heme-transporting ATPase CcmA [Usitatibacteraceae bacterium]
MAVRGLALERGGRALFTGLSFSVAPGNGLVLRGANGSGKTSLLRILAGLTRADAGEVVWNGKAWRGGGGDQRAGGLYIGHANALKDELTAAENLAEALAFDGLKIDDEVQELALEQMGLRSRRQVPARRLSQGQKRRIGLARLSLSAKPLWLLDEPTNALDTEGVAIFTRLVQQHLADGGVTCIATHVPLDLSAGELNLGEAP